MIDIYLKRLEKVLNCAVKYVFSDDTYYTIVYKNKIQRDKYFLKNNKRILLRDFKL